MDWFVQFQECFNGGCAFVLLLVFDFFCLFCTLQHKHDQTCIHSFPYLLTESSPIAIITSSALFQFIRFKKYLKKVFNGIKGLTLPNPWSTSSTSIPICTIYSIFLHASCQSLKFFCCNCGILLEYKINQISSMVTTYSSVFFTNVQWFSLWPNWSFCPIPNYKYKSHALDSKH